MDLRNSLGQAGLLMIFGAIISLIFTFLFVPQILESFEYLDIAVQRPMLIISFVVGLTVSIFQLYVGVKGVQSWQIDENAGNCIKLGIMFLIFKIATDVMYTMFLGNPNMIFRLVAYIIVILFIIGAIIGRKYENMYFDEDFIIDEQENNTPIQSENFFQSQIQNSNEVVNQDTISSQNQNSLRKSLKDRIDPQGENRVILKKDDKNEF